MSRASLMFVVALAVLSCGGGTASGQAASAAAADLADWPDHNGGPDESAYSPLHEIDKANVRQLGLAWSLDLRGEQSLEATPLAVGGVLYFTGSHAAVYAVDAVSGKLLWKFDPQTWKYNPTKLMFMFGVNRGVAYADNRIFTATLDGRLIALDATTGKLLWSVETVPASGIRTVTGAPRAFNGKVIIGNAGGDIGERGYVTAYDAATGRQLWRFYTVPGTLEENKGDAAMERAAATWSGDYWKSGTGGAVWDSITFDPDLNRIYLGTGNAGPYDAGKRSPGNGDNLYVASIVALDADTGRYVWHYQETPRDAWDYDATQQMTLAELVIDGERRKVLMQAPKNGFFYVLDRRTGHLISAAKLGKVTWAERVDPATGRPVEAKDVRWYETGQAIVWPGPAGDHSWQSMSFSPKTGLVYIPYMQLGGRFHKGQPEPGTLYIGDANIANYKADAQDGTAALLAWDPVKQQLRWKVPLATFWNGGTLATAGGLVFQGMGDGRFSAYDAYTGERLWSFDAGLGIIAAPISYAVHGRQYVSVLVGYGGSAAILGQPVGWKYDVQVPRLLTFSLDGKAVLPHTPPADMSVKALDDPSLRINQADAVAGQMLYNLSCATCHGLNLRSAGYPAPDLRESGVAVSEDALGKLLQEGTLIEHGMPAYPMFKPEQVRQLHAYIRAGAREALATRKPADGNGSARAPHD